VETAILDGLRAAGKDPDALTAEDLAPVDQLHSGGRRGTIELLRLAELQPGIRVLDVGGGLGGPARTLAQELDATVVVLDLSREFCRVGELLTRRTGLTDRVSFLHGDALAMPVPDGTFDAVWMQNAGMSIADKDRLYREVYRVLRTGGRFALQEVVAGPAQPLHFPVVWAADASMSFLVTADELRSLLDRIGFTEVAWADVTESIRAGRRRHSGGAASADALPPLGLHLILGAERFLQTQATGDRNLAENRVSYIQAVMKRPILS
jgi:ubiquinone/menaquinone biosynthesis C-methylase UbiE